MKVEFYDETYQLQVAEEFVETVGTLLCHSLHKDGYDIHLHINEIYQQTLAFFYKSIFILLYDDIEFSQREHIWTELIQRMNDVSVDCYLWTKSTCSFFTNFCALHDIPSNKNSQCSP